MENNRRTITVVFLENSLIKKRTILKDQVKMAARLVRVLQRNSTNRRERVGGREGTEIEIDSL